MGVDLGGADAGVAEELFDADEVGTVFEKMGGVAVAEHVGRGFAVPTPLAESGFDIALEGAHREGKSAVIEKERALWGEGDAADASDSYISSAMTLLGVGRFSL